MRVTFCTSKIMKNHQASYLYSCPSRHRSAHFRDGRSLKPSNPRKKTQHSCRGAFSTLLAGFFVFGLTFVSVCICVCSCQTSSLALMGFSSHPGTQWSRKLHELIISFATGSARTMCTINPLNLPHIRGQTRRPDSRAGTLTQITADI